MVLTHSFKETVKARAERDPVFRDALLTEAVDQFLAGDLDTGKPCCGTTPWPATWTLGSRAAGLHQRHHRLPALSPGNRFLVQEPDADAQPVWQSDREQPVCGAAQHPACDWRAPSRRGRALTSPSSRCRFVT
jgi:hypothetical protein